MPRISTKTHAAADYATGALLLAAPGLAGVRDARARALLRGVGAAVLGQALVTDWELALIRRLPVRAHLAADAVTGATLLASPPLLRLGARGTGAWLPLAVVGLAEGALAALTRPEASGAEGAGGARAGQGLHQARVPGAPDDQPDHRPRAVPTDRLPDADREAGLKPTLAAAPVEAPGPSVPAPGGGPGSTTERMERIDATTPDAESLGVRDQDPLDQLAAREE